MIVSRNPDTLQKRRHHGQPSRVSPREDLNVSGDLQVGSIVACAHKSVAIVPCFF